MTVYVDLSSCPHGNGWRDVIDMETVAEWSWRTYPAPLGAGGVGSIPANPDALNVPSFRRRRFEMKLSP